MPTKAQSTLTQLARRVVPRQTTLQTTLGYKLRKQINKLNLMKEVDVTEEANTTKEAMDQRKQQMEDPASMF